MHLSLRKALEGFIGIVGLTTLLFGLACLLIGLYDYSEASLVLGVILWCSGFLIGNSLILIHRFL